MLYYGIGVSATASIGQAADIIPHYIQISSAVILATLIIFALSQGVPHAVRSFSLSGKIRG
jgi:hypothetical protein